MNYHLRKLICIFLLVFTSVVYAVDNTTPPISKKEDDTTYLFIQTAMSGKMFKNSKTNDYTVTLYNVDPWVTYFSDIPKRVTGFMPILDFIKIITEEEKNPSFKGLNTGLIAFVKDNSDKDIVRQIFTLRDLQYNPARSRLTFKADIVPGDQTHPVPKQANFRHVALFIDSVCVSCIGGTF